MSHGQVNQQLHWMWRQDSDFSRNRRPLLCWPTCKHGAAICQLTYDTFSCVVFLLAPPGSSWLLLAPWEGCKQILVHPSPNTPRALHPSYPLMLHMAASHESMRAAMQGMRCSFSCD